MERIEHKWIKEKKVTMQRQVNSIDYVLFTSLFLLYSNGYLLNELFKRYSLPPIFTILRLFILLVILLRCMQGYFRLSNNVKFILCTILIMSAYFVGISIIDGELILGLISLRTYIEPFFVYILVAFYINNVGITNRLVAIYINTILFTAIISLIFYSIYYIGYLEYFVSEYSTCFLPGMIFRSFLPIGDPNALGLLLSCGIMVVYLSDIARKKIIQITLLLSLLLTFSKSAILALLFFFALSIFTKVKNMIKISFIVGGILGGGYIILKHYFYESPLYSYLLNLFAGEDPSSNGHLYSYLEAIEKIHEYFLFGYPTGTVGSRMTDMAYNVESSFFILLYDKGIIFFVMYISIVFMLLINVARNSAVIRYILSIILGLFFLPTIQFVECLSLIAISPLLISKSTYKAGCV